MRSTLLGTLLALLAVTPLVGQVRVRTEVDTARVTLGGRVTMRVSVEHEASSHVAWPDSLDLSPFEVLGVRRLPTETTSDGAVSAAELTLTAFELGELEIPAFDLEVVDEEGEAEVLATDRYVIEVASVGVDETGDIREIRGPLSIPLGPLRLLLWVLLPLLVAGLLYGIARRLRPRSDDAPRREPAPPPRPPHEIALEALAALEASPLLERGQVKEFHIAVSDILRTYVEGRFRVDALEMTTTEVLEGLARAGADDWFTEDLRRFLEQCDLVKFAKARPDASDSRRILELGRRLVTESAPREKPAEAA